MNVDSPEYKKVVDYLRHLSLSPDEITAYLYLLSHGPQTVLALSRGIKTGRTKLYPLLENLSEKQLILSNQRHYGTTYQAFSAESIELLVSETEKKAQSLRSDLPAILQNVKQLELTSPITSKINDYPDKDGLRQLYWETSQFQGEKLIAPLKSVQKTLGSAFLAKNPLNRAIIYQKHPFDQEIHLYGNNIALFSSDYGLLISNQLLVDHYKTIFNLLCK